MSLRYELIQVAAVAVAIVEQLDTGQAKVSGMGGHTDEIMTDITNERVFQDRKWGPQKHPLGDWMTILGEEYGEACQAALDEVIFP